ncbi:MAG: hypothetical protein ABGY42_04370, partial [bacterium]
LGSMTMEQFIALGDRIFNTRGTCTLCHSEVGGRAPALGAAATSARPVARRAIAASARAAGALGDPEKQKL